MRGPYDRNIEAQQGPAATESLAAVTEGERRRPPGGNALLRLLHMLESAGYAGTAEATVRAAVSEEYREQFEALAMRFSAAPPGVPGYDRATLTGLSDEDREATGRDIASAELPNRDPLGSARGHQQDAA